MKYLIIFLFTFYPLTIMSEDSESDLTLIPNKNIVSIVSEGYDIFTISASGKDSFDVHLIKDNDYIICKIGHKTTNCYSLSGKTS